MGLATLFAEFYRPHNPKGRSMIRPQSPVRNVAVLIVIGLIASAGGMSVTFAQDRAADDPKPKLPPDQNAGHSAIARSGLLPAYTASEPTAAEEQLLEKADAILARMTPVEKVAFVHGIDQFNYGAVPRLNIPKVGMNDGPQGVRGPAATAFPCALAMAATWDPELIAKVGEILGLETLANGNRVHLGPAINLMRTPLGGRTFEYMGEDPLLAGKTAASYIRGLQSTGVAASLKHYVGNEQDTDRFEINIEMDERTLREIYAKPFEIAVREAHPWTVMGSYNKFRGRWACENAHLLEGILKGDWHFDGTVVSDWGAWHDTARSVNAGCDLAMPGELSAERDKTELAQLRSGAISAQRLDDAVRRNLLLWLRTASPSNPKGQATSPAHQRVARKVAAESIVLLKNDHQTLPLDLSSLSSVAVIGPAADWQSNGTGPGTDGGSGRVFPPHDITPLVGLQTALGKGVKINYEPGYSFDDSLPAIPATALRIPNGGQDARGLAVEYFGNKDFSGKALSSGVDTSLEKYYQGPPARGVPEYNFSARWTGSLSPPTTGTYTLGLTCDDGGRVILDGKTVLDDFTEHGSHTTTVKIELNAGQAYDLKVEYFNAGGSALVKLGWLLPGDDPSAGLKRAAQAARDSDVAVVCVGITHTYDHEGSDKPTMDLIGPANALVKAVMAANPRTIVVLTGGSPMDLEAFADVVPAVVLQWYPGMEGGHALADVLTGRVNPSGKLPVTFGKKLTDYSANALDHETYPGVAGTMNYKDGIWIGYRHFDRAGIQPRYPFGYGLSYTTFDYQSLKITPGAQGWDVAFDLRNTGKVAGREVVQLYVGQTDSPIRRARRELKAFDAVELPAGESRRVTMHLAPRDLAYWSVAKDGWDVLPGTYTVQIGSSSRDLKLDGELTVE